MIEKITVGNWYMCLENISDTDYYGGPLKCYKGYIYKCIPYMGNGWLVDYHNCMFSIPTRRYKDLRLATKEEIENISIHGSPNL